MTKYIELLEGTDEFPEKLKLTTPAGEFILDGKKITGYDYSNYRKKIMEGDLIQSREDLKKKALILDQEKKYEDLEKEDFLVDMILDKAIEMILTPHEKFSVDSDYFKILDRHEVFKHIIKIEVKIQEQTFVLNRKNMRVSDYQEQKKSLMDGTFERVNQNMISKLIENKEDFSMSTMMLKPFWFYKRLDNAKNLLVGDEKPF